MVKLRLMFSAALALSLLVLSGFVAITASAHTPTVAVTCDNLSVTLADYNPSVGPNRLTVTINGKVVHDATFGFGVSKTFTAPDRYAAFTYVIKVTAADDPTGSAGWSFTKYGSSTPCVPPKAPTGGFTQVCTDTGAEVTIGNLDSGTAEDVVWTLTHGGTATTVHQGDKVSVSPEVALDLSYKTKSGETASVQSGTSMKACPVVVTPPSGSFTTECTANGAQADVGTLSEGSATGGRFELRSGTTVVVVTSGQQNVTVPASATVRLYYVPSSGPDVQLDYKGSTAACPPVETPPAGSFTTECTATGAQADVGTLTEGTHTGGRFELRSGSTIVVVTSGQQNVTVPADATVKLYYVPSSGDDVLLDTEQSPKACTPPVVTPAAGSFTTECTTTGAQADVGTLTEGTHTGGRFELRSGSTVVVVTSGQQNVTVPASATVTLVYVPATGADSVLDTEQTPAACVQPVAPQRDLSVAKSVSPTGAVQFGATLTYTLSVSATGNAPQTNVVVTDQVPTGTTYVADSASCDAGTCSPTFSNGTVAWGLGGMAAGTTRSVTFKVTVNTPEADEDGALPAVEVRNAGAVNSTEVPSKPSNEVVTPVSAVLGVKTGPNDTSDTPDESTPEVVQASGTPGTAVLAATGGAVPWPATAGLAALLLLSGIVLVGIGRRPTGRHTAG